MGTATDTLEVLPAQSSAVTVMALEPAVGAMPAIDQVASNCPDRVMAAAPLPPFPSDQLTFDSHVLSEAVP